MTPPTYHKIQTVYLRDPETRMKTLLDGEYAMPEFGWLADNEWEFTEKVDGTCVRVWEAGGVAQYGGKTERASLHVGLLNHLRATFDAKADAIKGLRLYGEGHGAKIQKGGGNYCPDQRFVLFDVQGYDEDRERWNWLPRAAVDDVAAALGIPSVPVIGSGTLHDMIAIVRDGFTSRWGEFAAEGIVARPKVEMCNRRGDRIITKLKHKDFRR